MNFSQLCAPRPRSHGPPDIDTPLPVNVNQPHFPHPVISHTATAPKAIMVGTATASRISGVMRAVGLQSSVRRADVTFQLNRIAISAGLNMTPANHGLAESLSRFPAK